MLFDGCFDETDEEGMRSVRAALEFRMGLGCDEVVVVGQLDGFHQTSVGAGAAYGEACLFQGRTVYVGDFVSMTVSFVNDFLAAVEFAGLAAFLEFARIDAEAHGAAFFGDVFLVGHEVDDRIGSVGDEFGGVCVFHAAYVSGEFNDSALHAEAESEEGDVVHPGIADGGNLAFDAAVAEAAGDDDAVDVFIDFA